MRNKQFSKACFYNALADLCNEYPYEEVQISQICQKAGFHRSTFYRTYQTKEDILKEKIGELIQEYTKNCTDKKLDSYQSVVYMFSFYRKNSQAFRLIYTARLDHFMQQVGLESFPLDTRHGCNEYRKIFILGGYLTVLAHWLETGMKESDEDMAKHILLSAYNK